MAKKRNRVGIIGGGQLASLLGAAAEELELEPVALADSSKEPGFRRCRGSYLHQPGDRHALEDFFSSVQTVAIENEFFSEDILQVASAYAEKMVPSLETLQLLRDKETQKKIFQKLEFLTAAFEVWDRARSSAEWVEACFKKWPQGVVFKWAQQGYDGKGVHVCDGSEACRKAAADFLEAGKARGVGVYAEEKIAIRRELALVGARSTSGYFAAYPLTVVESRQGVCEWVYGPATSFGVSGLMESRAVQMAGRFAVETGLSGVFALEFFEDDQGRLWVNEMAPRVHNTGHYTLDAAETSQFTNHWQTLLGLAPGDTTVPVAAFAMLNLLGPEGTTVAELLPVDLRLPAGISYYDYQKMESRPLRKLGHLNGVTDSVEELPTLRKSMQQVADEWARQVRAQGASQK